MAPTQRLEWRDLAAGCGAQAECRADLARLERHLSDVCPRAAGCGDPVARLLYVERTAAQRASGLYPDALPRAADVLAAWQVVAPTATPGPDRPGR